MVVVEFVLFLDSWSILQDEWVLVLNVVKCSVTGAAGLVSWNRAYLMPMLLLLISTLVSMILLIAIGCCIMVSVAIIMSNGLNPSAWCCLPMSVPIIGIMTVPVVSMRVSQHRSCMRMRCG